MPTISLVRDSLEAKFYPAGSTIFEQGEPDDITLYLIQEGEVDIIINDRLVETVSAGGIFGEMTMIDHRPRSATAVAHSDCRVMPINTTRFNYLVQESPSFAIQIMQAMAERIRRLDGYMTVQATPYDYTDG